MAHVFLADGRRLRVRLFPSLKQKPRRRRAAPSSLSLFDQPADESQGYIRRASRRAHC